VGLAIAVAGRAASVLVTLLGLLLLTFIVARVVPIDPVLFVVGETADQSAYDRAFRELGLDRPIHVQFLSYVGNLLSGDFSRSLTTRNPVLDDIVRVYPATLELATLSMLIGTAIGIPLGVISAARQDSAVDFAARVFGLLGYSTPSFWLGLMGLIVFYGTLGWIGGPGRLGDVHLYTYTPVTGFVLIDAILMGDADLLVNALSHIILPATILGYSISAYLSRLTRSFMLEQLGQEYILAARSKGVPEREVVWGHAFRAIRVQLLTVLVLTFGLLLEGAVVTETIFAWPGFGRYLVNSMLTGDMNAVMGCVLIIGILFIALNLLSDVLYRRLDPRAD
jgi:peptide/nickel transport system permease protein